MCGIVGFFDAARNGKCDEDEAIVRQMADALIHRGPDDGGVWCDREAGIALGHRRLAILDLSPQGRQPMHSPCGRYVIVFNGEIYNFKSIRAELEQKGRRFRGNSDTEVALAACAEWGVTAALQRFNGMFALAIWDKQRRVLDLARDRFGQKPLYCSWVNGAFLFSSELKAFYRFPGFAPAVNRDALTLLFRRGCIAAPYSIFKDVYKLKPAHRIRIDARAIAAGRKEMAQEPYWSIAEVLEQGEANPFKWSEADAVEALHDLLQDAVKLCMISDVPLGAFLSGGIDSSTIVALMQAQSAKPVRTFSIGFWDEEYNEAKHAAKVAAHFGTDHTELYVTEQDALEVIPELPQIFDEPFADSSQIPTYLVSKLARREVTVALSGDGGDEIFAGYKKYQDFNLLQYLARFPAPVLLAMASLARILPLPKARSWQAMPLGRIGHWLAARQFKEKALGMARFLEVSRAPEEMYIRLASIWKTPAELVPGALEPSTFLTASAQWPRLGNYVRVATAVDMLGYLPDDILVKVDRAAMAVSLETRIPLLDHRLLELVARLPLKMSYWSGTSKALLRKVLYRFVPRPLVERPKMGFKIPVDSWLRGKLRAWAEDLLAPNRLEAEGFLARNLIRQKWQEHLAGVHNWGGYLWPVLMFQAWQERWLSSTKPLSIEKTKKTSYKISSFARPVKKLKILFVIDSLGGGGTERSVAELLPYLIQANFTPIIVCFYRREGAESEVIAQGFDVRFLEGKGLVAWVRQLRHIIKVEKPDIIHTMLYNADLAGRIAAIGSSAIVVSSLVNTPYEAVRFRDPRIKAYKLRVVQMIDWLTSRCLTKHFHAVSQAAKDSAIASLRIPAERITVVERGRNTDRLARPSAERRLQARERLCLTDQDEVIVNLGRHEYQKGQKYLLEAFAKLASAHPRLVLLVAGHQGNLTNELENLKDRLGLNGQVRFLGFRNDVADILAAADLFVFPSLYEGLPGAVIEAMALGLPIVASDIPPVREVVEENRNAILVAPTSSSELAKAIATLLDDRDKALAYGRYSRKIFETRFTLQQSAARMIELYHQVAAFKNGKQVPE